MRQLGFIIFPDFNLLDFAGPLTAFDTVSRDLPSPLYQCHALSVDGGLVKSTPGIEVMSEPLDNQRHFDTLVIAGGRGVMAAMNNAQIQDFLRHQYRLGRRVTSVCSGAFILAATGLLDDKRVTTHWSKAQRLQRCFPAIRVDQDKIFIQQGRLWTSAGISAGIDLALALIEQDEGREVAASTARQLVVYQRRAGGQSQFSVLQALDPSSDRIRMALSYAREHLAAPLSVGDLADAACLSLRQFGRLFRSETGQTPAKIIEQLRVEAARERIECGHETLEVVARQVGFVDPERMRRAFIRLTGQPPQGLRRLAQRG
ncbi:GlxA family transcriptional regulator [Rouxiella badensis]|jgi:transcriptional regulator GlxA family with amidase domain|uniref:AraC family transcriptional regulator n=1 Tax=Rouxiella badensis TaxID=1646377 RepID=A0A1X0WA89_9GAMM|nr:GlxA family transcriptional regulator [Rouxiella badensis]MCC3702911.1 GlxA family transcriptional regulator [Rouxiella badensis]MCC3720239.1 GlxA family transcriptional regulator [Rouxiella badensis]MCC3729902.1 GlxA family transcriptional regulator [Rouxiella badensis]MCC3741389.1 GlxA family transcriptional regulator [Rouxiella badensis]MCC3748401.1 GlxA family transcriptional regulator [Rouxiella badensis]